MSTQAAPFDYNAPLPDLHIRQARSWEPAARHYRDLTDTETVRETQARAQEADRIGPDQERADTYEREDHG